MTSVDYDVGDDTIAVVEDTDLPRRLKDEVYETLESREGATVEEADELSKAVETRYLNTRVPRSTPSGRSRPSRSANPAPS